MHLMIHSSGHEVPIVAPPPQMLFPRSSCICMPNFIFLGTKVLQDMVVEGLMPTNPYSKSPFLALFWPVAPTVKGVARWNLPNFHVVHRSSSRYLS